VRRIPGAISLIALIDVLVAIVCVLFPQFSAETG